MYLAYFQGNATLTRLVVPPIFAGLVKDKPRVGGRLHFEPVSASVSRHFAEMELPCDPQHNPDLKSKPITTLDRMSDGCLLVNTSKGHYLLDPVK